MTPLGYSNGNEKVYDPLNDALWKLIAKNSYQRGRRNHYEYYMSTATTVVILNERIPMRDTLYMDGNSLREFSPHAAFETDSISTHNCSSKLILDPYEKKQIVNTFRTLQEKEKVDMDQVALPAEVIVTIAEHSFWYNESTRRSLFYNLVFVERAFNDALTPLLYREYEHSDNDEYQKENLRMLLRTNGKNPHLAGLLRKLTIDSWFPESFMLASSSSENPQIEPIDQLLSIASNVCELQIPIPSTSNVLRKPFHELEKLSLKPRNPSISITRARALGDETLVTRSGQLALDCLIDIFPLPKLAVLEFAAFECIGERLLRHMKPFESKIKALRVHCGCIDTSLVGKILRSVGELKEYRYSVMEINHYSMELRSHPNMTPSTRIIAEHLQRHSETLEILELTKNIGLSTAEDEKIHSLHEFEKLQSLCIDASMLIGRWHCKHLAGRVGEGTLHTVMDLDQPEWRPASALAECLPTRLEELILGIDEDKSDDYVLDIIQGIVQQQGRLSNRRRIALFRLNASYCGQCTEGHGTGPIDVSNLVSKWLLGTTVVRQSRLRRRINEVIDGKNIKVYITFTYTPWPYRHQL